MQPSSDRLADDNDGVRASDAERDRAIGELRDRYAEGRLSQETFLVRMDAALNAKSRSDLSELFTDLPAEARRPGAGGAAGTAQLAADGLYPQAWAEDQAAESSACSHPLSAGHSAAAAVAAAA